MHGERGSFFFALDSDRTMLLPRGVSKFGIAHPPFIPFHPGPTSGTTYSGRDALGLVPPQADFRPRRAFVRLSRRLRRCTRRDSLLLKFVSHIFLAHSSESYGFSRLCEVLSTVPCFSTTHSLRRTRTACRVGPLLSAPLLHHPRAALGWADDTACRDHEAALNLLQGTFEQRVVTEDNSRL